MPEALPFWDDVFVRQNPFCARQHNTYVLYCMAKEEDMNQQFDYEVSFEDEIGHCVAFDVTYTPGDPGKLSGPPENCYPPTGPDIDIENLRVNLGKGKTRKLTAEDFKAIGVEDEDELVEKILKDHLDGISEAAAEEAEGPDPSDFIDEETGRGRRGAYRAACRRWRM